MKAIGYIRKSTKDQSNFSITGQTDLVANYCTNNKYDLISTFVDDGKSAKDFDRPDWKKLEQFIKSNQADYLIVMKYDRFSRDLLQALQKIELLENKHKIRIISVLEPIPLHPQSPFYFKMRADYLTAAQTELLLIRDRTKFGINAGQKAGRYLRKAPFGYLNSRDGQDLPIIVLDPLRARIIQGIFNLFLQGETPYKIGIWARGEGFTITGKSAIMRVLTNPTYAGLIKVNKYYDDPERLIKGLHEGIVTEETFYKVQALLNFRDKQHKTILRDEVPLRATLLCYCGRPLTAGESKGKKRYYWYYKCNTHYQVNLSAEKIHYQLQEAFNNLSLPIRLINAIETKIEKQVKEYQSVATDIVTEKSRQIKAIEKQMTSLEEKYLNNQFDYEAYDKWKKKLNTDLLTLRIDLQHKQSVTDIRTYNLSALVQMGAIYKMADTIQKQALISSVFNSSLYYFEGAYRTPYLLDIFHPKAALLKEKRLLYYEQPDDWEHKSSISTPKVTKIEHLLKFCEVLTNIKAA